MAEPKEETKPQNETVPGGRFIVNDVVVNAEGELLEGANEKETEKTENEAEEVAKKGRK